MPCSLSYLWQRFRVFTGGEKHQAHPCDSEDVFNRDNPLQQEEKWLLSRLSEVRQQTVSDLMVPRVDIQSISWEASPHEVKSYLMRCSHSRLIVYGKSLDDLKGFVHLKDLVRLWFQDASLKKRADLIQKPLIVVGSLPALDALTMMGDAHASLAVVVDEFGGVDGLLTPSDIMQSVLPHINENGHEAVSIHMLSPGIYEADGRLSLTEFSKVIGVSFQEEQKEEEIDTLGGLIVAFLGRVPSPKELIMHPKGFQCLILDSNPRTVKKIQIFMKNES